MNKTIILLLILTVLSGCYPSKIRRSIKNNNKGKIVQKDYIYRIPSRFEHNLIFVTVEIEGEEYNFLLDTGATTIISYELYEKLNYKKKKHTNLLRDSQGNIRSGYFTDIPELRLGELTYKNIGSQIVNFRNVLEFKCLEIDGIFGVNHMSKAIWEIDYENQEIIVTNDIKKIDLSDTFIEIDFSTTPLKKSPKIPMAIKGLEVDDITYDTGSNGYISLSGDFLNKLNNNYEHVDYYGYSASAGLFGRKYSQEITRITKVPLIELGKSEKLALHNNIIKIGMVSTSSLLGNEFLKNYRTILDWNQNKIYLIKKKDFEKTSYDSFGFDLQIIDNNLIVTRTITGMSNLKVNDQII